MDPITFLTYIAVILLFGVLFSALANKIKIPDILFFIFFGILIGHVEYQGKLLFEFPILFITSISLLALAMIVFESASIANLPFSTASAS